MAKGNPGHGYHHVRGDLHPGERLRQDCIEIDEIANSPEKIAPDFFVPNFSVYRPVMATEEMQNFHSELQNYCSGRPYRPVPLHLMSMRILEQAEVISIFHEANVMPLADDIDELADKVQIGLKSQVKSKPHRFDMISGSIHRFGKDENTARSFAVVSEGWKGFKARYSRKDGDRHLFNSQFVHEANIVLGAIANTFVDELDMDGEVTELDIRPLKARAPHITLATKTRGNRISNNEIAEVSGQIAEFMPSEIPLFDPVIYRKLDRDDSNTYLDWRDRPVDYKRITTVRNPKIRDFGHYLLGRLGRNS